MSPNIPQHTPVNKRHVLYFSGFDPRGPAHYRRLYRAEAAKQAVLNGMTIDFSKSEKTSTLASGWKMQTQCEGRTVETTYEFMRWEDVISHHWPRNDLILMARYLRALRHYLTSGVLWKIRKESIWMFIAAVYPAFLMLAVLGLGVGAVIGIDWLAQAASLPRWLGIAAGLIAFGLVIQGGRLIERLSNSFWLARSMAFHTQQALGATPDLDARLDEFAHYLADLVRDSEANEVLLVGHSSGAIIAAAVLGRALQRYPKLTAHRPRISLMTLGQCIPILSLFPQAKSFHAELAAIAHADRLDWIDFTAPTDLACFVFLDTVALAGIRRDNMEPRPKLLSARFVTLFSAESYARIRRSWYRNHFQYLMAGEKAGEYDYFAITAGPLSLAERYRAKPSLDKSVLRKAKP
ncbi:hypothetical protein [Janthinobacterium sp. 17J80-10]|uniref:alpha/beta fold hydrolase n=1 Tax=Janthinobacterium sp. 17J80-10 TaxID=2497863 RepID=UPI001005379A|nr:hypothetical protein [Janthinobacterium sp. 17J80-10]QAU33575.1 hypothetical protein EKL02_04910 [Janthinobacterium sp. 17J80-10]